MRYSSIVLLLCTLFLLSCTQQINLEETFTLGDGPTKVLVIQDVQNQQTQSFYQEVFPSIEKEYIQTQKITLAIADIPSTTDGIEATKAVYCAYEQNKYKAYMDILLENIEQIERGHLIKYAKILQLDEGQFTSCLDTTIIPIQTTPYPPLTIVIGNEILQQPTFSQVQKALE